MSYRRLKLERPLAESLVAYCEQNLVLPDDLVRRATGQKSKEPFLLDVRQLGGRSETERMLRILYALWKSAPGSFEKAAEGLGGTRRLWFARDWHLISDTGSSNFCQRISDSPWYVSTNCPYNGMMSRVEKIMTKMGFSWRYTLFVAWFITDGKGRLWQDDYFGPVVFPMTPPNSSNTPPPVVLCPAASPSPATNAATPAGKSGIPKIGKRGWLGVAIAIFGASATKRWLGCLGLTMGILVVLGIIGVTVGPSDSTTSDASSSSGSPWGWGSRLEKNMVGVYECASPMWALQLKYGGDYVMEALQSGDTFRGTWSGSGSSGLLQGTFPSKANMTISICSDGAIVIDKYGYTFVRTR